MPRTAFDIIESNRTREEEKWKSTPVPASFCGDPGDRPARARRPGLSCRHARSGDDKVPAIDGSDLLGISFAFGLVITALVYAIGKVSGCHINPAVTFALAATSASRGARCLHYWGAQLVGGTLGAFGIWALFTQTGIDMGLGAASFNEDTYSWGSAVFAEFIGTGILMFAILGIVDSRSPGTSPAS